MALNHHVDASEATPCPRRRTSFFQAAASKIQGRKTHHKVKAEKEETRGQNTHHHLPMKSRKRVPQFICVFKKTCKTSKNRMSLLILKRSSWVGFVCFAPLAIVQIRRVKRGRGGNHSSQGRLGEKKRGSWQLVSCKCDGLVQAHSSWGCSEELATIPQLLQHCPLLDWLLS